MRIYLACTVRGDRSGLEAARLIAGRLERHGHEVLTRHLLADDVDQAESALTERQVFARDLAWLTSCDALVAEASGSSYGVGFEVGLVTGLAPRSGQRVVLAYDARRRSQVSRLVIGHDHPACTSLAYASLDQLASEIDHLFGPAAGRDARENRS